jgi:hypothetical protein
MNFSQTPRLIIQKQQFGTLTADADQTNVARPKTDPNTDREAI